MSKLIDMSCLLGIIYNSLDLSGFTGMMCISNDLASLFFIIYILKSIFICMMKLHDYCFNTNHAHLGYIMFRK